MEIIRHLERGEHLALIKMPAGCKPVHCVFSGEGKEHNCKVYVKIWTYMVKDRVQTANVIRSLLWSLNPKAMWINDIGGGVQGQGDAVRRVVKKTQ